MADGPRTLAERAQKATAPRRSAQEALDRARAAEETKKAAEGARKAQAAADAEEARRAEERREIARRAVEQARERIAAQQRQQAAERAARERSEAEDLAAAERAAYAPARRAPSAAPTTGPLETSLAEGRVRAVLERLGEGPFDVLSAWIDVRPEVQVVLWQAHARRARHERDLRGVALCTLVAAALAERPHAVVAARVSWAGRAWAVWLDTERREVLAALEPADRYLTGL